MRLTLLVGLVLITGCASSTLTLTSSPTGAYLAQHGGGLSGISPLKVQYQPGTLQAHRDAQGCYLVKGWTATWVSGAKADTPTLQLCGNVRQNWNFQIERPNNAPGIEKDIAHAAQVQQPQGVSMGEAAALMLMGGAAQASQKPTAPPPPRVVFPETAECISTAQGREVRTQCKDTTLGR